MTTSFDLILKGGIVVNQDGTGARDIGVNAGRIAAIGDLGTASAGESIDCSNAAIMLSSVERGQHTIAHIQSDCRPSRIPSRKSDAKAIISLSVIQPSVHRAQTDRQADRP